MNLPDALCRRIRGSDHPPRISTAGYHRRLSAVAAYAASDRHLAYWDLGCALKYVDRQYVATIL